MIQSVTINSKVTSYFMLLLFFCLSLNLTAQRISKLPDAKIYIENNLKKFDLKKEDVLNIKLSSEVFDKITGVSHLYLTQQINGIDVMGTMIGIHFQNDEVVHSTSQFIKNGSNKTNRSSSSLSASDALSKATSHLGITMNKIPALLEPSLGADQSMKFSKGDIAEREIPVRLVYKKNNNSLVLCWQVEIYEIGQQHYWMLFIDAATGNIFEKHDLVIKCEFGGNHLANDKSKDSPHTHTHSHEHSNLPSIPKSELNLESLVMPNNSYAIIPEPFEAPNDPGVSSATMPLVNTLGGAVDATSPSPFGWHSIDGSTFIPDVKGNNVEVIQEGLGGAPLLPSNLATVPPFEFHFPIDLSTELPGQYTDVAMTNLFYWNNLMHDVFFNFGFDEASGNFQTTNITPDGLGGDPVKADAQDPSGTNNANMLTLPDGAAPQMQMFLWGSLLAPTLDGDLDNGIIAHEYGHGITNRLTGGPMAATPLAGSEQGGEGWSDYFALYMALQTDDLLPATAEHPNGILPPHGIGTYVLEQDFNNGKGIRPARYTSDLAINSFTYIDVASPGISVPHGVGFIWCTMLYDMTQNIVDIVPVNNDLYQNGHTVGAGGNNIALQLIMEGLKLQEVSPTFVQQRDAILKADTMFFSSTYSCAIWEAFAKRGLGIQAKSGLNSISDEQENFDLPLSCGGSPNPVVTIKKESNGSVSNGDLLTFDITVSNDICALYPATDVVVKDVLPSNMTFLSATGGGVHNNGVVTFPAIPLITAGSSITFSITVQVFQTGTLTDLFFEDRMENGAGNWTVLNINAMATGWELQNNDPFSGSNVWFSTDSVQNSENRLTFANPIMVEPDMILSFYHQYAMEANFDGGVVEVSEDGGTSWTKLENQMIKNGYNNNVPVENNPANFGAVFSGSSGGYIETQVDLDEFAGQSILIRFRLSNDVGTFVKGWSIDDVRLLSKNPVTETNVADYEDVLGNTGEDDDIVVLVNSNCVLSETYFVDADGDGLGDPGSDGIDFCAGTPPPPGFVDNQDDCDDNNAGDDLAVITPTPEGQYYATDQLSSDGPLSTTNSVIFQAGFEVVMTPGFVAAAGSDFHAFIEPDCPFDSPSTPLVQDTPTDNTLEVSDKIAKTIEEDVSNTIIENTIEDVKINDDNLMIYPNPTQNETTIELDLGELSMVTISVFDATGNRIEDLVSNRKTEAGKSSIQYNTSKLSQGVYMVVLKTERKNTIQRLVIIRN